MEVGKFYESVYNGLVVRCTTTRRGESFGGVVVEKGKGGYDIGLNLDSWLCAAFKEYTPTQALVNGHKYTIPDGCKATVKDGVITIESNVRYYKKDKITYRIYARVEGVKMVKLVIDVDGSKDIFIRYGLTGDKHGEECTEEEFMKVYNSIKIEL